ncbi:hypothetical protein BG000_005255, partial [Podila horticola]
MSAVRSEYQQQLLDEDETARRRRPILMQFMYPIRSFMSRWEMMAYTKAVETQRRPRGLTLAGAYRLGLELGRKRLQDAEVRDERDRLWSVSGRDWWNEYDAAEPYEAAR